MREIIKPIHEGVVFRIMENGRTIAMVDNEQDAKDFAALPELVEAAKEYLSLLESDYTGKRDYSNGAIGRITDLLAKMGRKP